MFNQPDDTEDKRRHTRETERQPKHDQKRGSLASS